ncbi:type II toxin-antitoxin system RelE/ParE family toxin [Rhodoluna sp.]|uniref:type II toxin-antitoxin system RelE family toxin n=1 Tax=Rhodoluna sp. TaxID=1969481 RepID=UPI0025CF0186|nr:type II toxin-antitoxin system RelE/ParE family toxin [Rhodoluna sp.]
MTYSLEFHPKALKAWKELDKAVQTRFKKKLSERLENPDIPSARLRGDLSQFFKIKLSSTGHRLVYEIIEQDLTLYVVSVGLRDDLAVYSSAKINTDT